jgi:hypothetical protein
MSLVAASAGASKTGVLDVSPPSREDWGELRAEAKKAGVKEPRLFQGMDACGNPQVCRSITGPWEVVCCAGVCYHCEDMEAPLRTVAAITTSTAIICSIVMPRLGKASVRDGEAVRIADADPVWLSTAQDLWRSRVGPGNEWMVDFSRESYGEEDYTVWRWLPSAGAVEQACARAGLRPIESFTYWEGWAIGFVCKPE